jgi:tetratricopeptide (TPR) repeat protein
MDIKLALTLPIPTLLAHRRCLPTLRFFACCFMSPRLLLIGLDAADWKVLHPLIDAGGMPTLNRLLDQGSSGELLGTQPILPAIEFTSMVTGKRAWQHGICHFAELSPNGGPPASITAAHRRSAALWQMLAHEGKRCVTIGWPATHGEQSKNTLIVSDRYSEPTAGPGIKPWPAAAPGTYWPAEIGRLLDTKRVSPEDIGPNVIAGYIPDWKKIDQKRDRRIGQLRLFLAADYSYQSAALELLKREPWDFAAIRFPALAAISRLFLPFHLDARDEDSKETFQPYRNVVRASLGVLDKMISQLIELAGPEAGVIVVSAHGVRTQGMPPGGFHPNDQTSWKTPHGIFLASGPRFVTDALVQGAGVLDVAPTLLTWFGLPIGDDKEGRVLIECFTQVPPVTRLDSWDTQIGIPAPNANNNADLANPVAEDLRRESDWNYVQSCQEAARYAEALPILERLFREFPERVDISHALFQCQLALGRLIEASTTLEVVLESLPAGVASLLPRAELAMAQGDTKLARSLAGEALKLNPANPLALRKLGVLLLRLREWDALAKIAKQALALDDGDPIAWLGLAVAQLRKGNATEAATAATRAIRLKFFLPDAHFVLARALVAEGKWIEAREAMQTLMTLQPDNRVATNYFKRLPPKLDSAEPL